MLISISFATASVLFAALSAYAGWADSCLIWLASAVMWGANICSDMRRRRFHALMMREIDRATPLEAFYEDGVEHCPQMVQAAHPTRQLLGWSRVEGTHYRFGPLGSRDPERR